MQIEAGTPGQVADQSLNAGAAWGVAPVARLSREEPCVVEPQYFLLPVEV